MIQALWWWLVAQVVALCALPLALALFRPLADRGYGLAKPFGLLLFGYVAWLLGTSRLIPNGLALLLLTLLLLAGGSALVLRRPGAIADLLAFWRRRRGLLLLEEALFLGAFLGFLVVRSHNPEISGTEKYMDFAFLNAVTRSTHFPPLDPWLAPSPSIPAPSINYYYFGYLIQGLLLQLANAVPEAVPPAVGFNLSLGLLFALAALASFSLGYGLARDLVAEGPAPGPRPGPTSNVRRPTSLPSRVARRPRTAVSGTRSRGPVWSLRAAWPYVATGFLATFLLLFAGNLWTALRLVDGSGMWNRDFWQGVGWNATRVLVIKEGERDVDYTINEFPAFSFLLGDLHPHVLTLPFALLAVGLAYRWLMAPPRLYRWAMEGQRPTSDGRPGESGGTLLRSAAGAVAEVLPGALILGSLYFLNSWDFPTYFLLAQAGALAGAWWQSRRGAAGDVGPWTLDLGRAGLRGAGTVALVGFLSLAAVAPFLLTFRPPVVAEGGGLPLGVVTQRSQLGQFVQFWGAQLLLLTPAVLVAAGALGLPPVLRRAAGGAWTGARAPAVSGIVAPKGAPLGAPGGEALLAHPLFLAGGAGLVVLLAEALFQAGTLVLALLLAGGAAWVARRALDGEDPGAGRPLAAAAGMVALAALLLAGCEVVHIRDFYGGALRRMNTVFKLYYQAWLLFAVGGSGCLFWLARRLSRHRREAPAAWNLALGAGALILVAMALFPLKVTLLRTNDFRNQPTLDGMAWLSRAQPDDRAAAEWLRLNGAAPIGTWARREPAPVVLEATGGPYSEYARMATQTGFPTVLGWDQHERLWRGQSIEAEVATRQRDVDAIYTAATLEAARPLLDKYGIAYVAVGYLERQKYGPSGGLAKFDQPPARPVFRQGQTVIYRLPTSPTGATGPTSP